MVTVGRVGVEPTFSTSYLGRVYQTRWISAVEPRTLSQVFSPVTGPHQLLT